MRSSLNGIIGVPQVLMEDENITDTQRQYLQMIIESGQNILNMINLSLTIYKIEQGTYEPTESEFDVLNIFKQCKTNYDLHLNSKNIEFITYTDGFDSANPNHIMVKGEELLAYSVISNLVKNAIEASPSGGTVEVCLSNSSKIIITINNQGAVPQNIRDTFFDKYTTSGKDNGTGLGTYSAKILAEAQGWEISMHTSEVEGTTTTLTIPK
ncbi:MAG: HAMP domain-containing sensor histidine kinase [Spirochaetia bacterium]|nr:HAMP domain-containing sensor histidine kinase [Spirochaetia bacterium]